MFYSEVENIHTLKICFTVITEENVTTGFYIWARLTAIFNSFISKTLTYIRMHALM